MNRKERMIKMIPIYERKSLVFNEIFNSYSKEFKKQDIEIERVNKNLFIDSSDETGLKIHERDFNIKVKNNQNIQDRKNYITSRWQSIFGQTTEESFKNTIKVLSGGAVEIEVITGDYPNSKWIEIINVNGKEYDVDLIQETIDRLWPAHYPRHLNHVFNFRVYVRQIAVSTLSNIEYCGDEVPDELSVIDNNEQRIKLRQFAISMLDTWAYAGEENIEEDRK